MPTSTQPMGHPVATDRSSGPLRRSSQVISEETLSLNLIWDYPVSWSRYKVLRDFVQNFYDSVGHEDWERRFQHALEGERLVLTAKGVSFSYEWLIPIGASTKRGTSGHHAGYFGEGAKMAALCALRDHGWRVEMASQDWELEVTTNDVVIDGRKLCSLAYRIRRTDVRRVDTTLTLHPFHRGDRSTLEAVLQSFYHPSNPLVGEALWCSGPVAIHHRTRAPKPEGYPSTYDYAGEGIIFASFQALGSFPFPLVFCAHDHRPKDRERNSYYRMDVMEVIKRCTREVPPEVATELLYILESRWREHPQGTYDFNTWHPIIGQLVQRAARSSKQVARWQAERPGLLVAPPVKRSDLPRYNRRRQALEWLETQPERYRLVQEGFSALGYPTLEEVCEAAGGFSVTRDPTAAERPYVMILEEAVHGVFAEALGGTALPPCRVILSPRAAWAGMALCVPAKRERRGLGGLLIRHELPYVALKAHLLGPGGFSSVLSTYLHELGHMYGGDRSSAFSRAVTYLLEMAVERAGELAVYRERWEAVGRAGRGRRGSR